MCLDITSAYNKMEKITGKWLECVALLCRVTAARVVESLVVKGF